MSHSTKMYKATVDWLLQRQYRFIEDKAWLTGCNENILPVSNADLIACLQCGLAKKIDNKLKHQIGFIAATKKGFSLGRGLECFVVGAYVPQQKTDRVIELQKTAIMRLDDFFHAIPCGKSPCKVLDTHRANGLNELQGLPQRKTRFYERFWRNNPESDYRL